MSAIPPPLIAPPSSRLSQRAPAQPTPPRIAYWHRTDLRLSDSPALTSALAIPDPQAFYHIWTFDPSYVYQTRVGLNRWSFLLDSMCDLSHHLTLLNPRQRLLVLRGKPEAVWPTIWKEWGITHLVFEVDRNGYSKIRDEGVKRLAGEVGVEVVEVQGRHLFDPLVVGKANAGKPTMTLNQWQKVTKKIGEVHKPALTPLTLPDPGETRLSMEKSDFVLEGVDMNARIRTGVDNCFDHLAGPNGDYAVPTMSEMGFGEPTTSIRGGTTEAHRRLELFLSQPAKVAQFSKPQTAPTSLEPSTTLLSPYLKFGCLGVRELWWGCQEVVDKFKGNKTKEPENMFGQLQFRDMYACAEAVNPDFERIRGNSVCRFIDWSLQNQYDGEGKEILPRPKEDEVDEERFEAWREGRTGFPWIDACMRQLKHEGWIHHLARHSTACFLTRGQCYISWERGMEVYDEWLVDWDPSSNPGNWMWLSCSAFFSQYFRVYGLVSWPQKTDKSGALVRKYCPELKGFPDKYIYSPHLAPEAVQQSANCIIGQDYPFPILDERAEKDRCIARIKNAFKMGFHGDSPEVLDGITAKGMLKKLTEATGAMSVKSEGEKKREVGERKRKRAGDGNLDGFFKKDGEGAMGDVEEGE